MKLIRWLFSKSEMNKFDIASLIIIQTLALLVSPWLYPFILPLLLVSVAVEQNLKDLDVLEQENDND